jgi:hypothetical protein
MSTTGKTSAGSDHVRSFDSQLEDVEGMHRETRRYLRRAVADFQVAVADIETGMWSADSDAKLERVAATLRRTWESLDALKSEIGLLAKAHESSPPADTKLETSAGLRGLLKAHPRRWSSPAIAAVLTLPADVRDDAEGWLDLLDRFDDAARRIVLAVPKAKRGRKAA